MARINWEEIRDKYVYGIEKDGKIEFPSIRDLAERYNVSRTSIGEKASKEKWTGQRLQYLDDRRTKTGQKVIEEISDKVAPLDTYLFEKVDQFIRGIGGIIDRLFPEPNKNEEPLKATDLLVFKTSDFFNLITSLRVAKELEKSVLGEGNNKEDKEIVQIIVASEKAKELTDKILKGERI